MAGATSPSLTQEKFKLMSMKSPTALQLKGEIRKQFFKRIGLTRDKELFKRRKIITDFASEVRLQLEAIRDSLRDNSGFEQLQLEEMLLIMETVEQEFLQDQAEEHMKDFLKETEDIANSAAVICQICNAVVGYGISKVICEDCERIAIQG